MKDDLVQGLLNRAMGWDKEGDTGIDKDQKTRPHLQTMAKYKYDSYQQYAPGMRFIESLALWLNQFKDKADKEVAIEFVRNRLIFISNSEMNHLVQIAYPDVLKPLLINLVSNEIGVHSFEIKKILESPDFQRKVRKSLFLGLSDGSRTDQFRRVNPDLSNEQVYQSHELSDQRADKMIKKLKADLSKRKPSSKIDESKYETLFLLDDFSASGNSYIRYENNSYQGKIAYVYDNAQGQVFKKLFDLKTVKVYIVLYFCTKKAQNQIATLIEKMWDIDYPRPELIPIYLLDDSNILDEQRDLDILSICKNDAYYDADELEDEHTRVGGANVKLGFAECKLPLVLSHNCPNNSVSILWAYDKANTKFSGLFPRVPRYKEL